MCVLCDLRSNGLYRRNLRVLPRQHVLANKSRISLLSIHTTVERMSGQ